LCGQGDATTQAALQDAHLILRAGKVCNQPGCSDLIPVGRYTHYCDTHAPAVRSGWDNRKPGRAWGPFRRKVMIRDQRRCVLCGRPATVVDHLLPEAWGGTETMANLRAMCGRCHLAKSQDESRLGRFMARMLPDERGDYIIEFIKTWR
jgi:5-methylcytosine-specific restriction enzyme A